MTGQLTWLASYPKSGNTWMRVLLTNFFRNADEPADINELDGFGIASGRALFDDNVGVEASDLTQEEIERLRPRVYEHVSRHLHAERTMSGETSVTPAIVKVHDAYTHTIDGVPLFAPTATAGAVYVMRDPVDVVSSFAHHSGRSVDQTIEAMGDEDFAFVDNTERLASQLRQRLLTWSGHVSSWVDQSEVPVIVVRYEELHAEPVATLARVVDFLGVEADVARLQKAVEFSAFDRLQAQEAESSFVERSSRAESFFRKGTVGDGYLALTDEQIEQVCSDHGDVMRRFGYLTERT